MIYFAAPDGFLVALDAKTGKVRWETKIDNGGITAGGILVADGKVLTNRTCTQGTREISASSPRTTPGPARRSGSSTPPRRRASRAATPGPTCRSSSAPPVPGVCRAPTIRSARLTYWGIANPNPYTRLTRHGSPDAVSHSAPSNLYSNSTVALDIATGKLDWYYQELPGDDWDADHNQERILLRTIVNPDARHVKWRATDLPRNQEREVVVTVGEGGGMFVVDRDGGKFLWAHPFPYDNPDLNMNEINPETGQTHVNVDKLFKKDGDKILGCFHNTRGLWSIAYHPGKNALYVPFQDQCLSMTANAKTKTGWGPRVGVMRPGIDPKKFMNLAKIDLSTGEMKILYSQPQPSQASALRHRRRPRVLGRCQPPLPRLRRRHRQGALGDGRRRHRDDLDHHLCGERQAVCRDPHRRRPVGHRGSARRDQEVDADAGARPQFGGGVRAAVRREWLQEQAEIRSAPGFPPRPAIRRLATGAAHCAARAGFRPRLDLLEPDRRRRRAHRFDANALNTRFPHEGMVRERGRSYVIAYTTLRAPLLLRASR